MSSAEPTAPWRPTQAGLLIAVRLTPRGGRDALGAIEVLSDGRAVLTARVRAAPTEGEANAALVKLIARSLKVPASRVTIAQGATSRVKMMLVEGDSLLLEKSILSAIA